jgi:glycine/sarcosine N-methyltransferase
MNAFDELALAYDQTIDWESRLERELPFILASFPIGKRLRILDIACGSGRHAVALAKQGHEVCAFDISKTMIRFAAELAASESVHVSFEVADMLELENRYSEPFDLMVCLGNSLALLPSFVQFQQTVSAAASMLSESGVLIFQVLNFEAVEEQGIRFMPTRTGTLHSGERVTFSRFLDYTQGDTEKAILVLSSIIEGNEKSPVVETQSVLRITRQTILDAVEMCGLKQYELYGNYSKKVLEPQLDRAIVVYAKR